MLKSAEKNNMTNNPGAILWKYLQMIHQLTENWRKAGEGWGEKG